MTNRIILLSVLILSTTLACAADTDIDVLGGSMMAPAVQVPDALLSSATVLWDLTRGVYRAYEPAGSYSGLTELLAANDMDMATTTAGVDNIDLSLFDVLVICLGSAWNNSYEAGEVAAITEFMAAGGGVLVLGDAANVRNHHINPVAAIIGAECGVATLTPDDLVVTDLSMHPVFDGVDTVFMRIAGGLVAASAAEQIAYSDAAKPVVIASAGGGMVVVGDTNFCTDEFLNADDNAVLALNIFQYLAGYDGVAVEGESWSGVKAYFR